jgi:hypothetical protein
VARAPLCRVLSVGISQGIHVLALTVLTSPRYTFPPRPPAGAESEIEIIKAGDRDLSIRFFPDKGSE